MTYSRFSLLLLGTTLVAGSCAALAHGYFAIGFAAPLTVGMLLLLAALSFLLFFLGKRTAGAKNKFLFGNVFMGVTMLQMFLAGGTVGAYFLLGQPENKYFVVPFFTSYLCYSALQVICLVILAGKVRGEAQSEAKGVVS